MPRTRTDHSGLPAAELKSARIEAAIARAIDEGDHADLLDQLSRNSSLPGPRANLDLARAVGIAIASRRGRADALVRALATRDDEFSRIVAALALAARLLSGVDPRGTDEALQTIAEDPRHHVRRGVVEALRMYIAQKGDAAVEALATWTDGYLQANAVLQALSDRSLLTTLRSSAPVLARLDEAFSLADTSPRAAERTQGLRALRSGLPGQIAAFAGRFSETITWLEGVTRAQRPETREVVSEAIRALRKSALSDAESARLHALLEASAPPLRDAARIVHGTRKRSKGRK